MHEQAARAAWSGKVRDVNEFLDELGLVRPEGEIRTVATYHDACHLRARAENLRRTATAARTNSRPRITRAAGNRTVLRGRRHVQPHASPKCRPASAAASWKTSDSTGARVAITSNAGCALQIAREAREQGYQLTVVHPMEMLDWSYRMLIPRW